MKRLLIYTLAAVFALSCAAGCGGNNNADTPVQEAKADALETTVEETTEKETETEPESKAEKLKEESILTPENITASSCLAPYYDAPTGINFTYDADRVNDHDIRYAWVEGSDGDGIGEYLEFTFPEGTVITGGLCYTGYYFDSSTFSKNCAVAGMDISSGGKSVSVDLTIPANFYNTDNSDKQFTLSEPIVSDGKVKVAITAIRAGSDYMDTCISELVFRGYAADAPETEYEKADLSEDDLKLISGMAYYMARRESYELQDLAVDVNNFTPEDRAFFVYWYQYKADDSRISKEGEFNYTDEATIRAIFEELFGSYSEEDMQAFMEKYAESNDGGRICMIGGGDFGDAGLYHLANATCKGKLDGRIQVLVDVIGNDGVTKQCTIWLVPNPNGGKGLFGGWILSNVEIADGTSLFSGYDLATDAYYAEEPVYAEPAYEEPFNGYNADGQPLGGWETDPTFIEGNTYSETYDPFAPGNAIGTAIN